MSHSSRLIPGMRSPAVGFEQPFEMLEACHERVQRSLDLLSRIVEHIDAHGHDDQSRAAAGDVLRYFDIAAPHHHEDEERHVFPPIAAHPDPQVRQAVITALEDHQQMHTLWQRLRAVLSAWRDADPAPGLTPADRALVAEFIGLYSSHIPLEENVIYPAAQSVLDAKMLAPIGHEMATRRQIDKR